MVLFVLAFVFENGLYQNLSAFHLSKKRRTVQRELKMGLGVQKAWSPPVYKEVHGDLRHGVL